MTLSSKHIDILGAGIMGLMAARSLCAAGHRVCVYDAGGFPAANASFMAGGMLAPYSEIEHMDMAWVEVGLAGIEAWRDIGLDCGFSAAGSLLIACPEDQYILERFRGHLPLSERDMVSARELEPALHDKFRNGVFLKEEAFVHPEKAMLALCESLKNHVEFKAQNIEPSNSKAEVVIDCRGMGAADPALRGVKGEILLVRNPEFSLSRPVRLMHPRYPLYIVPRGNGVFMIGATQVESEGGGVQLRSAMELMSALYALHPSFGEAEVLSVKAGIRPSYADNLPRISAGEHVISCNGLFRHGYLFSPVMAQCVTNYLAGETHEFMHLFRKDDDEYHDQRAA